MQVKDWIQEVMQNNTPHTPEAQLTSQNNEPVTTIQMTTGEKTTGKKTTGEKTTGKKTTDKKTTGEKTTGEITTQGLADKSAQERLPISSLFYLARCVIYYFY